MPLRIILPLVIGTILIILIAMLIIGEEEPCV